MEVGFDKLVAQELIDGGYRLSGKEAVLFVRRRDSAITLLEGKVNKDSTDTASVRVLKQLKSFDAPNQISLRADGNNQPEKTAEKR